jgi:hypothetical protein
MVILCVIIKNNSFRFAVLRRVTKIPSPHPLCFPHLQNRDAHNSPSLATGHYFLPFDRISGQRAKTDVVRPPRGVNSPRMTHHSGLMAATMSRSILLTAFS